MRTVDIERENECALYACLDILGKINCVFAQSDKVHVRTVLGSVRVRSDGAIRIYRDRLDGAYSNYDRAQDACAVIAKKTGRLHLKHKQSIPYYELHVLLLNHVWNNPEVAHIIGVLELSKEYT